MGTNEKKKAVDAAIAGITKQFGHGAIMQLGAEVETKVAVIPTGSVGLDRALGTGGWARGRLTELYGTASLATRSAVALHAVAQCQALGGIASYIDLRHALDIETARRIGVRIADLLISQPETGEQALEIALHLVRSGAVDLIVVDVETLLLRSELEGETPAQAAGAEAGAARFISQSLRQLTAAISRSGTALLFLDEQEKGAPGNNALKFYSSVRVELNTDGRACTTNGLDVGTLAKVVKNKMAPPFQSALVPFVEGGIAREAEVLQHAVALGLVEKMGSHFAIGGERIGQGEERAVEWLRERPAMTEELAQKILATKAVL